MRGVDPSTYTVFLATIALVVAIGATVVYRLKRDVDEDDRPVTDDEIAREFERAYFSGEMDEGEYRRVSESLRARRAGSAPVRATRPPEMAPDPAGEEAVGPDPGPETEGPMGPRVEAETGAGPP